MLYAQTIKKELLEMWQLVHSQLIKSWQSFGDFDQDLAREIMLIEERVDCSEFLIDKECEVCMALSSDQAKEFPFIMFALKINRNLERIGDIAADIAHEIIDTRVPYKKKLIKQTKILVAYDIGIKMFEITQLAFDKKDVVLAELVIKRGKYLEGFFKDINTIIKSYVKEPDDDISSSVHILSIVRNLESLVELTNCLSKEIIAYSYGNRTERIAS